MLSLSFYVVSIQYSTSNHNHRAPDLLRTKLYLFSILHQTTTNRRHPCVYHSCIYSVFYIKPQQQGLREKNKKGCIYSVFYIKPQLFAFQDVAGTCCIYSVFYIKPQHHRRCLIRIPRCIYSVFYIKPQLWAFWGVFFIVVSIQYSTSNHNRLLRKRLELVVVSIQYSTSNHNTSKPIAC